MKQTGNTLKLFALLTAASAIKGDDAPLNSIVPIQQMVNQPPAGLDFAIPPGEVVKAFAAMPYDMDPDVDLAPYIAQHFPIADKILKEFKVAYDKGNENSAAYECVVDNRRAFFDKKISHDVMRLNHGEMLKYAMHHACYNEAHLSVTEELATIAYCEKITINGHPAINELPDTPERRKLQESLQELTAPSLDQASNVPPYHAPANLENAVDIIKQRLQFLTPPNENTALPPTSNKKFMMNGYIIEHVNKGGRGR